MESVLHRGFEIFIYESMLDTRGYVLRELYCESHRQEPWAVWGQTAPYGALRFPNVLYVDAAARAKLRQAIGEQLHAAPGYPARVERRFRGEGRRLLHALARLRARRGSPRRAFTAAARVLSSGVFKEAFDPPQLAALLERFLPMKALEPRLSQLYQPRCLPHALKQRAQLLFAAAHLGKGRSAKSPQVRAAARRSGYLSDFVMEDGPLDDPHAMAAELKQLWEQHGSKQRLLAARGALLERHAAAVRTAAALEAELLATAAGAGPATLHSRTVVLDALRLVAWLSTAEELKHILALRAARTLRGCLEQLRLPLEQTSIESLEFHWRRAPGVFGGRSV